MAYRRDSAKLLSGLDGRGRGDGGTRRVAVASVLAGIVITFVVLGAYHAAGNSRFCGSCHSMGPVYGQWQQSRHKQFACIDCHMPVGNPATRVGYKAWVGMRDLYREALRDYGARARLSPGSETIVSDNCRRCHHSTIEGTALLRERTSCTRCHRNLVHGG